MVIYAIVYLYLHNVSIVANAISKIVKNVFIKYEHYIVVQLSTLVYVEINIDLIISVV
jgi:hypothetical protein